MPLLNIIILAVAGVGALWILGVAFVSKKPIRCLLCNALLGLAGLAAVHFTARFTGVRLPLTYTAVGTASVFGLPAVCGMVLLNFLL